VCRSPYNGILLPPSTGSPGVQHLVLPISNSAANLDANSAVYPSLTEDLAVAAEPLAVQIDVQEASTNQRATSTASNTEPPAVMVMASSMPTLAISNMAGSPSQAPDTPVQQQLQQLSSSPSRLRGDLVILATTSTAGDVRSVRLPNSLPYMPQEPSHGPETLAISSQNPLGAPVTPVAVPTEAVLEEQHGRVDL
jgi:hypothetical protein